MIPLPEILNEVHRLIEERGTRFLLTGSSARKLRRGGQVRILPYGEFLDALWGGEFDR